MGHINGGVKEQLQMEVVLTILMTTAIQELVSQDLETVAQPINTTIYSVQTVIIEIPATVLI